LLHLPCWLLGEVRTRYDQNQLPALHQAAHLGNLDTVLQLIGTGAKPEQSDQSGVLTARHHAVLGGHGQLSSLLAILQCDDVTDLSSAFIHACRHGKTESASILLERGIADSSTEEEECSGLGHAISGNHLNTVCMLLDNNDNWPEIYDHQGLMLAALSGNPELFDKVLERQQTLHSEDLSVQDNDGRTALHWAVLGGHLSMVEKLLARGISSDIGNTAGNTALHIAAMEDHCQLIKPLVQAMNNTHALNNDGFSVLMIAALYGNTEVCHNILKMEIVDPNIQDSTGNTALHRLANCAAESDIDIFCEYHADPDLCNDHGETVLMRCISLGNLEAAQSLLTLETLERNINVEAINETGQSALHLLSRHHLDTLVEPLVDAGADINALDEAGNTPLMQAVMDNSMETVLAFTDELAALDIQNKAGKTAIDLTQEQKRPEIENLLQDCLAEQRELNSSAATCD